MYSNNLPEETAVDFSYFLLLEGRKAMAFKTLAEVQMPKTAEYFYNLALCENYAQNHIQAAQHFEKVLSCLPLNMGNNSFAPKNESWAKLMQAEAEAQNYYAPVKMGYAVNFTQQMSIGAIRILADLYKVTAQPDKLANITAALKKYNFCNI